MTARNSLNTKQNILAQGGLREAVADVAAQADFVRVNAVSVPAYTEKLLAEYPLIKTLDAGVHFVSASAPERTAAYVLALDSINFGSGWMGTETGLDYESVAGGLKAAFLQGGMDTPEKWAVATSEDCRKIFGVNAAGDELLALFAEHLRATGHVLLRDYGGDALALVAAAQGSAQRLVEIVAQWPNFADIAMYKGRVVPFLKRAQILAADMNLAFDGGLFGDIAMLTAFADNMVPHVLRCDGILEYLPELAARIDAGEEIAAGSAEETELRACAIHAVELMRAAAPAGITAVNLDHILWHRGQEPAIAARPAHRTKTVWY